MSTPIAERLGIEFPLFAFSFLVWINAVVHKERNGAAVGWFYVMFTGGMPTIGSLVAIVLMGIVGAITLGGVVRSLNVSAEATTRVDALTEVQRAVERISRRMAGELRERFRI